MILFDCSDEYDELLTNGMFRNRERHGIPISGSDEDLYRPSLIERKLDQITEKGQYSQKARVGGITA